MKKHEKILNNLPFYLNGTLDQKEQEEVREHLRTCAECREELAFWQEMRGEIEHENQQMVSQTGLPSRSLVDKAVQPSQPGIRPVWQRFGRLAKLVRAQLPIVRSEIWLASLLVIFIGCAISLLMDKAEFLYFAAPLVAAAGLAIIYTPENDVALELVSATPVSQAQILLARTLLVFGYDLILVLIGMLVLSPGLIGPLSFPILLDWLAPMTFLSSLALGLSIFTGTGNAILTAYLLWIMRFIIKAYEDLWALNPAPNFSFQIGEAVTHFWQNSILLLVLSLVLILLAGVFVERVEMIKRPSNNQLTF